MFKINEYFDGKVASIGFQQPDGTATVGVMAPGEYPAGTQFVVAAHSKFKLKVEEDTAYLCEYR